MAKLIIGLTIPYSDPLFENLVSLMNECQHNGDKAVDCDRCPALNICRKRWDSMAETLKDSTMSVRQFRLAVKKFSTMQPRIM